MLENQLFCSESELQIYQEGAESPFKKSLLLKQKNIPSAQIKNNISPDAWGTIFSFLGLKEKILQGQLSLLHYKIAMNILSQYPPAFMLGQVIPYRDPASCDAMMPTLRRCIPLDEAKRAANRRQNTGFHLLYPTFMQALKASGLAQKKLEQKTHTERDEAPIILKVISGKTSGNIKNGLEDLLLIGAAFVNPAQTQLYKCETVLHPDRENKYPFFGILDKEGLEKKLEKPDRSPNLYLEP